jgi:hypothetical protein
MATRTANMKPAQEHRENATPDFVLPVVDLEEAARFKPSRVRGKHVMWLVTFVAGMGVSRCPWSSLTSSSPCLDMIKVS